jgi:aspartyl-tRNA(Asn)/glutamyl-tRNA(Gln) amidotransferase subunit B
MIENYELVLGMEIHLQLDTQKKMFCSCKNDPFESEPNANVCPVCLGLPGAMPVANLEAIRKAQLMVHHLGLKLNDKIIYERKNYFYPDLPKSFQLTCPHHPIGIGGDFSYPSNGNNNVVRWREVHLEEDTAKSSHEDKITKIDFNKSGVPLLEMVTEPDFHSIEDAVNFCKEIQLYARYLGISEASMEKGHMRLEANISVRKKGETDLPNYRVELKNINSFGFMRKALAFELRRQAEALSVGETLYQETRGFNEKTGKTFLQRSKEDAQDYRYFPEPDIPVIEIDKSWLEEITTSKAETPKSRRERLISLQLNNQYVEILVSNEDQFSKFTSLLNAQIPANKAANFVINEAAYAGKTAQEIIDAEKAKQTDKISDTSEIENFVKQAIEANPKAVEDYKKGNQNAVQFLIGQVMKLSKGKADAMVVRDNIERIMNG